MAHKKKKKRRRLKKPIRLFLRLGTLGLCLFGLISLQAKFNLWQTFSNHSNILEVLAKSMDFMDEEDDQESSQVEISDFSASSSEASPTEEVVVPVEENLEPIATILVDPGHGGLDSGTVAITSENKTVYESTLNLQAAYAFKECMAQINPRIRIEFTRSTEQSTIDESQEDFDEVNDLNNRVAMIDQYQADYFLSLHCNASNDPNMYGYELFIKSSDAFSQALSDRVASEFAQINWPCGNGTLYTDYYPLHVVDLAKVPTMLVEMGYMSHEGELANLVDSQSRQALMYSLAKAYSDCIMANTI